MLGGGAVEIWHPGVRIAGVKGVLDGIVIIGVE